jgi:hypothetical protein
MKKKAKNDCYERILDRLEAVESSLGKVFKDIQDIKEGYLSEICQDEIDADKAAYEAAREICLDSLFDMKPKGDA